MPEYQIPPIIVPTYPLPSISIKINLGLNSTQVRRNIRDYNLQLGGLINQRVNDNTLTLAPGDVYMSNTNEIFTGVLLVTDQPVTVTVSDANGLVYNSPINRIYANDAPLSAIRIVNSGLVAANVYLSTVTQAAPNSGTSPTNQVSFYGALDDPGVYDNNLISRLLPGGPGIADIFTSNPSTTQYIWYAYPTALGVASFIVNGFVDGFTLMTTNATFNGYAYTIYRSDNPGLGQTNVSVS